MYLLDSFLHLTDLALGVATDLLDVDERTLGLERNISFRAVLKDEDNVLYLDHGCLRSLYLRQAHEVLVTLHPEAHALGIP